MRRPRGSCAASQPPCTCTTGDAMRRIRDLIPGVRLIAIIRDPVERAHSNWTHLWSAGLEPVGDLVQACADEERRIAAGWASFWHYTGLGRYGEQLEHIFTLFPREQVYVIRYRQGFVDNPATTLDGIFGFLLGVEQGVVTEVPRQNVTAHPEATLAHRAVAQGPRASFGYRPVPARGRAERVTGRLGRPPAPPPGTAAARLAAAPGAHPAL